MKISEQEELSLTFDEAKTIVLEQVEVCPEHRLAAIIYQYRSALFSPKTYNICDQCMRDVLTYGRLNPVYYFPDKNDIIIGLLNGDLPEGVTCI
jgi:hypothetical protein